MTELEDNDNQAAKKTEFKPYKSKYVIEENSNNPALNIIVEGRANSSGGTQKDNGNATASQKNNRVVIIKNLAYSPKLKVEINNQNTA